MQSTMTRKRFNELYGREPLVDVDHGTICVRGHEVTPWTLRFFVAQGIASLASLMLKAAYAVNPEEHSATYRVYEPSR